MKQAIGARSAGCAILEIQFDVQARMAEQELHPTLSEMKGVIFTLLAIAAGLLSIERTTAHGQAWR